MTALVQARQPLQVLDPMSNQNKRPRGDRRATSFDDEDGDFQFARRSKRVKPSKPQPIPEEEDPPPALATAPPVAAPKRGRPLRKQKEQPPPSPAPAAPARQPRRQLDDLPPESDDDTPPAPPPQAKPKNKRQGRGRPPRASLENPEQPVNGVPQGKALRRTPPPEPRESTPVDDQPQKIALPISDTPVMNRNKEMRNKKKEGRRSSVGLRGRRASSLIDSGHTAIPHREVSAAEFFKHIEADGLTEPRRMKQLLTWCGERALAEKPPLGSSNSNAILGARAIQDQLLKDFAAKSEFSDWFPREDVPKAPTIVKPNPRNIEHDEKIAQLEERIKKLKAEKKAWQAIRHPPPVDTAPLLDGIPPPKTDDDQEMAGASQQPVRLPKPDSSLLDSDDARILESLTGPASTTFRTLRPQIQSRLQSLQASLEFKIDRLADNVHKVEQRVASASGQADRTLALSAARLREREEREKKRAGTRDMPVMEVLRSLGRILPDAGG